MAKNTPAFQFYPQDFLGGVGFLSDEAIGVYIKLLCVLWTNGNQIPNDAYQLARATGTDLEVMHRVWPKLEVKFEIEGENVTHARFTRAIELAEIRRIAGAKGGRPKAKRNQKGNLNKSILPEERSMKNEERSIEIEAEDWVFPDGWDRADVREALDGWASMRVREKMPIKSLISTSKVFKRFDSPEHLIAAAEECEANAWQGLKTKFGKTASDGPGGRKLSAGEITARTDF